MKRAVLCLISIIMCCGLCACDAVKALGDATPKIGVLCAPTSPILPSAASLAGTSQYTLEYASVPNIEMAAKCTKQIEAGCKVIVLATDSAEVCSELASLAKSANVPLILLGANAPDEVMDSYDKLWHLGAASINGGEQLGLAIGKYYIDNKIPDINGDGILQIGFVSNDDTDMHKGVVQAAADLGVYSSDEVAAASVTQEQSYSTTAALLADNPQTELIASDSAANSRGAALAISDAGLTIPIVSLGDEQGLAAAYSEGIVMAYCAYPETEIFAATLSFINNVLKGEAVASGTNLRMNEHKSVLFSYENVSE